MKIPLYDLQDRNKKGKSHDLSPLLPALSMFPPKLPPLRQSVLLELQRPPKRTGQHSCADDKHFIAGGATQVARKNIQWVRIWVGSWTLHAHEKPSVTQDPWTRTRQAMNHVLQLASHVHVMRDHDRP